MIEDKGYIYICRRRVFAKDLVRGWGLRNKAKNASNPEALLSVAKFYGGLQTVDYGLWTT